MFYVLSDVLKSSYSEKNNNNFYCIFHRMNQQGVFDYDVSLKQVQKNV